MFRLLFRLESIILIYSNMQAAGHFIYTSVFNYESMPVMIKKKYTKMLNVLSNYNPISLLLVFLSGNLKFKRVLKLSNGR